MQTARCAACQQATRQLERAGRMGFKLQSAHTYWAAAALLATVALYTFYGGESHARLLRSSTGVAALGPASCGKYMTAFHRMPLALEVPLSKEQSQQARDEGAFARFSLKQNMSIGAGGEQRNISLYAYLERDYMSSKVLQSGNWEFDMIAGVLAQLYRFAAEKGVPKEEVYLLDVGANIGSYTVAAAAHGFSVLAFEAMYSNAMAVRLSLCANGITDSRVTLINKGLGNASSSCSLYSVDNNFSNGFLRCGDGKDQDVPWGGIKRASLDIVRLDDALDALLPHLAGKVGAVKMDVEGFESHVIEGGRNFLQVVAPPFVVTECDDASLLAQTGQSAGRLFHKMADLGYSVYNSSGVEIPRESFQDYKCGWLGTITYKRKGS